MLLGPLEAMRARGTGGESMIGKGRAQAPGQRASISLFGKPILRSDLSRIGLLGVGGFGAVELVEHNETKDTYALKALSKGYVVKCGMKKGVMSEKDIQLMCDSAFIVKLYK